MSVAKDGYSQTMTAAVRMTEIEGRGRALVATQPLRAGQTVLTDSPILVYSALPFTLSHQQQQNNNSIYCYCSNCFRLLHPSTPTVVSCPSCSSSSAPTGTSLFCSPNCRSIALASSHTPWVCQTLSRLRDYPSPLLQHHQDRQLQARFLVAAYNLAVVSPSAFRTLLSLQGDCHSAATQPDDAAHFLHFLISSLSPPPLSSFGVEFSLELTASLLAKDKLNAFGLMEPFAQDRERSVRAYGIYPKASFFNHDCLPNACRFDYLDAQPAGEVLSNTDIIIRVIHDVPQGREICLSYFPVNLNYSDRQRRLREDYGFTCECDRCKVEANWSESDDEEVEVEVDNNEDDDEAAMDEDCDEHMESENAGVVEGENDFPHAYFFLTYMCNRNNCWGTLAPLPPTDATPSRVVECNVCGNCEEVMDGDALEK